MLKGMENYRTRRIFVSRRVSVTQITFKRCIQVSVSSYDIAWTPLVSCWIACRL